MGETANFQRPTGGQSAFNDWFGQLDNEATINGLQRKLQPSQELMVFQRKFRNVTLKATVNAGQVALFSRQVPLGEIWKLHFVSVRQTDNVGKTVQLEIVQDNLPLAINYMISRRVLQSNLDTPLYPSMAVEGEEFSFFDQRGGPAPQLLAGDTLKIIQVSVGVGAAQIWSLTLRYEILPGVNEAKLDNDWSVDVL